MAQTYYDTEQKLKNYLATDQLKQERLCLSVLSLNKKYSEIKPRQPYGGPDHGRDIQALYEDNYKSFIAVGFKQDANDSNEQIQSIKKKFNDDLESALKNAENEKIELKVFVFFTNLRLTVDIIEDFKNQARNKGLYYCDIYNRERILEVLNTPDGYAIRFEFLDISLTEEEQKSFFSKWGSDIQSVISNGFQEQKNAINRMIFLQESQIPINYLYVSYKLKKEYSSDEIGHFRIVSEFVFVDTLDFEEKKYVMGLSLFRSDNPERYNKESKPTPPGIKYGFSGCTTLRLITESEETEEKEFMINSFSSLGQERLTYISMDYSNGQLVRYPPVIRINNLDKAHFIPIISENLCDKIESIEVYANGYLLFKISSDDISFRDINENTLKDFPSYLTDEESKIKWKLVENKKGFMYQFDFIGSTPKRIIGY